MSEKEQSTGYAIGRAIRAERHSTGTIDRSNLNGSLVKSPRWITNTLQKRSDEIEGLRQAIVRLETENASLIAEHQRELDARRVELLEFQKAYDQFEQQSDQLLNELDQQNERLRTESRRHNSRSLL